VVIRLLSVSGKGVEVVTSAEVASSPVLDSEVSGTIASLRERFEAVRRSEIHRVRGRLGNLSSDQEEVVESLSRGIIEKGAPVGGGNVVERCCSQSVCLCRRDGAQDFQSANVRLLFRASPSTCWLPGIRCGVAKPPAKTGKLPLSA